MLVEALISLALAQEPPRSSATFIDGNELLAMCRHLENGLPALHCAAYIVAVADHESDIQVFGVSGQFCIPLGVNARQMRDVVVVYLEANPGTRHYTAASLTTAALKEVFPCT